MPEIDEFSAISKDIEEIIEKEIHRIMEEAENKKRQILEEYAKKAEKEIQKINSEVKKIIDKEEERINSLIRLETKRKQAHLKNELIDEVFLKINERLIDFSKTNQYIDLLKNFIKQGIEKLVELIKIQEKDSEISLIIKLNQSDSTKISKDWLNELEKKYEIKLVLASSIQTIGGAIINTENESISYDNTFEGRILRKRTEIRIKIASILFAGG